MQLTRLSNSLKPITLAATIISSTAAFAYSDLDSFSGILTNTTNDLTSNYIKQIDEKSNEDVSLYNSFRFQNHLKKWREKTLFLSSTKSIVENTDFQAIVAMGHIAVPYIIQEIDKEPSTLVWALNFIFNRKISDSPDLTIPKACKLWVAELKK